MKSERLCTAHQQIVGEAWSIKARRKPKSCPESRYRLLTDGPLARGRGPLCNVRVSARATCQRSLRASCPSTHRTSAPMLSSLLPPPPIPPGLPHPAGHRPTGLLPPLPGRPRLRPAPRTPGPPHQPAGRAAGRCCGSSCTSTTFRKELSRSRVLRYRWRRRRRGAGPQGAGGPAAGGVCAPGGGGGCCGKRAAVHQRIVLCSHLITSTAGMVTFAVGRMRPWWHSGVWASQRASCLCPCMLAGRDYPT